MGLTPVITSVGTAKIVFQDIDDTAQGGFSLDPTGLPVGSTIPAGQPIGFDESTRVGKVCKVAEVTAIVANNAVAIQVKKGHLFIVGDFLGKTVGGAAHTITAIDTSNANFDTITIDVTLGVALAIGDVLFGSSAAGVNACAIAVSPRGLLKNDVDVAQDAPLTVVLDGIAYERRVPKAGPVLSALMPAILYSQSY